MKKITLLIVDDEEDLVKGLKRLLSSHLDIEILIETSAKQALNILDKFNVNIVLADIRMPEIDGLKLLELIKNKNPLIDVIIMTAYGSIDIAVDALKKGAYDFITKPIEIDRLIHILKNCINQQNLILKNKELEAKLKNKEFIIGESEKIKSILKTINVVAKTDLTVLIQGESGTGKELAAKMIHELSNRNEKELIIVNCPAIPENLLESELFGYKKGAFTNANHDKKGLIELADGSTLFLDEIGDISLSVQTKLLRFLQEGEIKPIGANQTKKVDVRVIAATNQDLLQKISKGQFREDLYHRLNVISIKMPSLREIREDIPIIAAYYLNEFCQKNGLKNKYLSHDAIDELLNYNWPGNIRELKNTIYRSALFSQGDLITSKDLVFDNPEAYKSSQSQSNEAPLTFDNLLNLSYHDAKEVLIKEFTSSYLTKKLKETNGNITLAAKNSGLERQYFQYLMKKFNISSSDFKA